MATSRPLPVRMCAVVPLEDGTHQAFCIACGWAAKPLTTREAAENRARQHQCPRQSRVPERR